MLSFPTLVPTLYCIEQLADARAAAQASSSALAAAETDFATALHGMTLLTDECCALQLVHYLLDVYILFI